MTTSSAESPKVFISYTHDSPEHMDRVLELANRLRAEGVDCQLEITREVDGLPLALDQAGAFIEESALSPAQYLELYKTRGSELRRERGGLATDHPESVATTFSLSFAKVEAANPTAADLLRACAFLAPGLIPEEVFTEGGTYLGDLLAATVNNRLAFVDAVKETLRYSFIHRDAYARTLSIHPVVQAVLKDNMNEGSRQQWAEKTAVALQNVLLSISNQWRKKPGSDLVLPVEQAITVVNKRLINIFKDNPELLRSIDPFMFEEIVTELFVEEGYEIVLTSPRADGGKDIYVYKTDPLTHTKFLVECKRYVPPSKVDVSIARQLYGVVQHERATGGIIVTTSYFTKPAREFAQSIPYQLSLIDFDNLSQWLKRTK